MRPYLLLFGAVGCAMGTCAWAYASTVAPKCLIITIPMMLMCIAGCWAYIMQFRECR